MYGREDVGYKTSLGQDYACYFTVLTRTVQADELACLLCVHSKDITTKPRGAEDRGHRKLAKLKDKCTLPLSKCDAHTALPIATYMQHRYTEHAQMIIHMHACNIIGEMSLLIVLQIPNTYVRFNTSNDHVLWQWSAIRQEMAWAFEHHGHL